MIIQILTVLHLVDKHEDEDSITINNLTLLNLFLIHFGPISEARLTTYLLLFQLACSCLAFFIRYPMAAYFYDS